MIFIVILELTVTSLGEGGFVINHALTWLYVKFYREGNILVPTVISESSARSGCLVLCDPGGTRRMVSLVISPMTGTYAIMR